jgi:hypothetical protein
MPDVASHSVVELLNGGREVEIRALRPDDRAEFLAAIERTSARSLFRRFLAAKRGFTEEEVAFYLNVDFVNHVALAAVMTEDGRPRLSAADVTLSCSLGQQKSLLPWSTGTRGEESVRH